jgi:hypothetical protein
MAGMLKALDIPYVHILPPNQYYSKKHFTPEEERVAIDWKNGSSMEGKSYYPMLLQEGKTLQSEGVDFLSAVDIFDDVKETIYTDTCCHFNVVGSLLLGKFIAEHIPQPR